MGSLLLSLAPDLHGNAALETRLLDDPGLRLPCLLLWRSPPSVVFGKNQNPWRECNLTYMEEQAIRPARRISGGGAVYHDEGNLNLSFIVDRASYRSEALLDWTSQALCRVGLPVSRAGRSNLCVPGGKIGGTAFCYRRERVLHHGTLLVHGDLAALRAALTPPRTRMETHAVGSLPAQVRNLRDLSPGLELEALAGDLAAAFVRDHDGAERLDPASYRDALWEQERDHQASAAWIWHQTPAFRIRLAGLDLHFRNGRCQNTGAPLSHALTGWLADQTGKNPGEIQRELFQAGLNLRLTVEPDAC